MCLSVTLRFLFAMASASFVFDEDDPAPLPAADRSSPSLTLSTGELNFDAFVEVFPPVGQTGGG